MRINIAQRHRPYSHLPGDKCLLPGSLLAVQAFPALLIVWDISGPAAKEVARHAWNVHGPVKDFTIQQDLEKGCVRVWGCAQNGYFRYHVVKSSSSYAVAVEKAPDQFGEVPAGVLDYPMISQERLSLGVDKQQDWCLVKRRLLLAEILPFWLRLGSMTPATPPTAEGTASLLQPNALQQILMCGFESILFPRLIDSGHQGFDLPPVVTAASPAIILSAGASLIRALFLRHEGSQIHLLPALPHELSSGRLIHVSCGNAGETDLEWRSRKLRRAVFRCQQDGSYDFVFPKALKTFRFREKDNVRGILHQNGCSLDLKEGHTYFFDLFEV